MLVSDGCECSFSKGYEYYDESRDVVEEEDFRRITVVEERFAFI